jgi:ribosomal protein L7Ae-like RNA K-turn-binding protein
VFARSARAAVVVPADLLLQVRLGLERRVVEHLGLARRAGQAVGGFVKARSWLDSGRAGLIVQACDASPDERTRLLGGRNVPAVAPLSAADLGSAFGRDHLVHVAIAHGRLAEALQLETGRLAGITSA